MRQRKEKSTEKFSCVKVETPGRVSCVKKKEKLLTICHVSNSKFNKNTLNINT